MDIAGIKDLARRVDESLPRGSIYHINYTVAEAHTDFYFDHNRELIKMLEANPDEGIRNIRSSDANGRTIPQREAFYGMINSLKQKLKSTKELSYTCDYTVDGIGFYVKQEGSWIRAC